jgi:hypothetical protein
MEGYEIRLILQGVSHDLLSNWKIIIIYQVRKQVPPIK